MYKEISVIVRNKNDSNIINCIDSFKELPEGTYELIIVDSSTNPLNITLDHLEIRYVYKEVARFEALNLGIKLARFRRILIIDSDQIVSPSLIYELSKSEEDMCIIRELSYNKNFVGRIHDRQREFLYNYSKKYISESLPVIPRYYKKEIIELAISMFKSSELSIITQHEDSVIYSEALKISRNVGFCNIPIFNIDSSFSIFAIKSFKYGIAQARAISSKEIRKEKVDLIRSIDRKRILYSKSDGFNRGIFYDLLKAIFYIPGLIVGKFKWWNS